ncbi:hypothetical protein ACODT5_12950 [Streptomyces sp. 5.8]|uniref:hypothetical protein n=1 Tax=Streptomyces sp. 5.8 TaxID=3406571 RepID=UPI003BB60014
MGGMQDKHQQPGKGREEQERERSGQDPQHRQPGKPSPEHKGRESERKGKGKESESKGQESSRQPADDVVPDRDRMPDEI